MAGDSGNTTNWSFDLGSIHGRSLRAIDAECLVRVETLLVIDLHYEKVELLRGLLNLWLGCFHVRECIYPVPVAK